MQQKQPFTKSIIFNKVKFAAQMRKTVTITIILFSFLYNAAQDSAQIYYHLGVNEFKQKRYQEAINDFTKSIQFHQSDSAYIQRGYAKQYIKGMGGSLADCDTAVTLNPHNPSAYFGRASAKSVKKDYYGAINDETMALLLDSNLWGAYINRGNFKCSVHNYNGAVDDYTKAANIHPSWPSSYTLRARAKVSKKDYNGALADYFICVNLDSCYAVTYYEIGEAYRLSGANHDAAKYYNKAIDLDPQTGYFYTAKGRTEVALGLNKEGCKDIEAGLKLGDKYAIDFIARLCK